MNSKENKIFQKNVVYILCTIYCKEFLNIYKKKKKKRNEMKYKQYEVKSNELIVRIKKSKFTITTITNSFYML